MKCEFCKVEMNGEYGSGRFCNSKCARAFSTKEKRSEINKIVSHKLKGRSNNHSGCFKKGEDERRRKFCETDWLRAVEVNQKRREDLYQNLEWDDLPIAEKRRRVLTEQDNKCDKCKLADWCGEPLLIEIHHVDGNNQNNQRKNLQGLCCNCHCQTPNYKNKKRMAR